MLSHHLIKVKPTKVVEAKAAKKMKRELRSMAPVM